MVHGGIKGAIEWGVFDDWVCLQNASAGIASNCTQPAQVEDHPPRGRYVSHGDLWSERVSGALRGRDLSIPSTLTFPEVCDTTEEACYGRVFREEKHLKNQGE